MNIVNKESYLKELTNNTVTAHSPIGASSMYRWSKCPASVRLSSQVSTPATSVYAEEGTTAHDWLAKLIMGLASPSNIPREEGMREAVVFAMDALRSLIAKIGVKDCLVWVEHGFSLEHIYKGCHGTADIVIYDKVNCILYVIDYKHGRGLLVECENNPQLMYYGLGALTTLKEIGEVKLVKLQVIQPRCPHPSGRFCRSWDIDPVDLVDFAIDLQEFAEATDDPDAVLNAGDHCRFCNAAPVCPELREQSFKVAKQDFGVIPEEGKIKLPKQGPELAKAMKWLPVLKSWIKSVDEFAYRTALAGESIPGYKLVNKRARRSWVDDNQIVKVLKKGGAIDSEIYEPRKVKSPAQVEKVLTKDERKVINEYVVSKSSGLALVEETDNREAVNPLENEFEKLNT